jgi:hypothetical membrane protein
MVRTPHQPQPTIMTWEFHKTNLVFGLVAFLGIAQFLYSAPHAMSVYPGGYSVTENFLSDLGCRATHRHEDNSASALIFNRSIVVLGFSLIPFFTVMPAVLPRRGLTIRCSGLLSAIGLIGVGLTPYDQYFVEHHLALGLWIAPMLVMVVNFAAGADLGRTVSTSLTVCTSLVVLAAWAYAFAGDHRGHVIFQKALAIFAVFWFCLVFLIVSVSTVQSVSSRRLTIERQARQYLEVIQRNHWRR